MNSAGPLPALVRDHEIAGRVNPGRSGPIHGGQGDRERAPAGRSPPPRLILNKVRDASVPMSATHSGVVGPGRGPCVLQVGIDQLRRPADVGDAELVCRNSFRAAEGRGRGRGRGHPARPESSRRACRRRVFGIWAIVRTWALPFRSREGRDPAPVPEFRSPRTPRTPSQGRRTAHALKLPTYLNTYGAPRWLSQGAERDIFATMHAQERRSGGLPSGRRRRAAPSRRIRERG